MKKSLIIYSSVLAFGCQGEIKQPAGSNFDGPESRSNVLMSPRPDVFISPHPDVFISPQEDMNSADIVEPQKDMRLGADLDTGDDLSMEPQNSTFAERIKAELAIDLEAQKMEATNYSMGQNRIIKVTQNGQIIKDLIIYAGVSDACGVEIDGYNDVEISNLTIYHANRGICASNSEGLKIKNIRLINLAAPDSGPHCVRSDNNIKTGECWDTRNASADVRLGISLKNAPNTTIENIYTVQASSGVYAVSSYF